MKEFMEIHHSTPVTPVPNTTVDGTNEEVNAMTTTPESRSNITPDNSNDKEATAMTTPETSNNVTPDNSNDKEATAMTTPETSNTSNTSNDVESKMMAMIRQRLGLRQPEETKAPAKKQDISHLKENIQRKLEGMLKSIGIYFSDEEKTMLLNFLMQEPIAEKASGARFALWPEGHSYMKQGISDEEEVFNTDEGYAILRKSKDGKSILNICLPSLTMKLRSKEYHESLRRALADWVIYTKKLQVPGWKINPRLDEDKVLESDREYLEKVLDNMMYSEAIESIIESIATHPEFQDIYTTSVVIGQNYRGEEVITFLFRVDAMEHASKMAYAFKDEECCYDILQGECSKMTIAGESYAAFDFDQPSCYLARGKKGLRPNIYLPEVMFKQFLDVTV